MAKISFDTYSENVSFNSNSSNVGYFNLKNDGDQAIVRFLHNSTDDFDIVTTHPIELDGKYKRVNCLRSPNEPFDNCPMCKSGAKIQNRIYIHLIHYVKDETGNIIPQAEIWERSMAYAATLKNLIDEYGPLSDCIFKVKRRGAARQMDTKYDIMLGNSKVYPDELYPKISDLFEGYEVVGRAVMNKSFEDLEYFVSHNNTFPKTENESTKSEEDVSHPINVPNMSNSNNSMPWENNNSQMNRPTRRY